MKACVLEDVGRLVYKDVPLPSVRNGEVLLRVHACGICSSDIPRIFVTGTYHFPTIPGHEFAGEVVQAADPENEKLIGLRAAVFPLIPCGECPSCQEGEYARCDHYNYLGSRCDGAFAEYVSVPVWNLVPLDNKVSYEEAALCEPTAVAKHCADAGDIQPGNYVAVVGTGTIGILAAYWAKLYGAKRVIVIGNSNRKKKKISEIGFSDYINSAEEDTVERVYQITEGRMADTVLECVGSSDSIGQALKLAKKGGNVVLTGNPDGDITLDKQTYWKVLRSELTVRGTWNSRFHTFQDDWKKTLECIGSGAIPVSRLISSKFSLDQSEEAMHLMKDKTKPVFKVMFTL